MRLKESEGSTAAGRRSIRPILIGGVLLIAAAGSLWIASPGWWSEPSESPLLTQRTAQRERAEFGIGGMDCIMCAAGLQNSLRGLPGVAKAEVSYQDRLAVVEFDPALINRARLEKAIEDSGFSLARVDTPQ